MLLQEVPLSGTDKSSVCTIASEHIKKYAESDSLPTELYKSIYSQEQLIHYAKCFASDPPQSTWLLQKILDIPGVLVRYGILFPLRLATLSAASIAFFTTLPVAVAANSNYMVSTLVKYYCKAILVSLGTVVEYNGEKPHLTEPHVFVANHTSYLDFILLSANRFPNAVVMARHGGALGFLQNYGLNFLHSMTFDRSNMEERRLLSERLKSHVMNPNTWPNPMVIFPEGTCVNNQYAIRFQKGAFQLGVKVCPVGIKYNRAWGDPYWDTRKGFLYYGFYRMTRWITPVKVVYILPQSQTEDENFADYGERVRKTIADSIGLKIEDFNGMAKRDLLDKINL
ncbi:hypothetical protein J3Q64DRAFT_1728436 [Phycomyces blakesleeanus]|uniref:Phospholipid/glycerol acyltransferase domain-containing protein n=1 Tax=Phycomyces blakesleeanus TaxID=4837 RepID=A0ABR3B853_PHYBL